MEIFLEVIKTVLGITVVGAIATAVAYGVFVVVSSKSLVAGLALFWETFIAVACFAGSFLTHGGDISFITPAWELFLAVSLASAVVVAMVGIPMLTIKAIGSIQSVKKLQSRGWRVLKVAMSVGLYFAFIVGALAISTLIPLLNGDINQLLGLG